MSTIAVIQPYFFPYAGYFRLFNAADTVVMFDCVQFPRRGWVHRNRFSLANGDTDWLTLPIAKAERDARIDELAFANDAEMRLTSALQRFPLLERARRSGEALMSSVLTLSGRDVTAYLCGLVVDVCAMLGFERRVIRSSTLRIDANLRGQERVIQIVRSLDGSRYVNPSGGRELYDHARFAQAGLELRFLTPYERSMDSVLSRLLSEPAGTIAREISEQTILVP